MGTSSDNVNTEEILVIPPQYKVTTMLVWLSNKINQGENNIPTLAMLGFLDLAMVASFKIAKEYRRCHQDQYNKMK